MMMTISDKNNIRWLWRWQSAALWTQTSSPRELSTIVAPMKVSYLSLKKCQLSLALEFLEWSIPQWGGKRHHPSESGNTRLCLPHVVPSQKKKCGLEYNHFVTKIHPPLFSPGERERGVSVRGAGRWRGRAGTCVLRPWWAACWGSSAGSSRVWRRKGCWTGRGWSDPRSSELSSCAWSHGHSCKQ